MPRIHVVFGEHGEYSDRFEYPVRAFENREMAKRLILDLQSLASEAKARIDKISWPDDRPDFPDYKTRMAMDSEEADFWDLLWEAAGAEEDAALQGLHEYDSRARISRYEMTRYWMVEVDYVPEI